VIPACGSKIAVPETATLKIRDGVGRIKSGIANPQQVNSQAASTVIAISNEKSEVRLNISQPSFGLVKNSGITRLCILAIDSAHIL